MLGLMSKTFLFTGKKELPTATIIILTSNNAEELRSLLYHLTSNALFNSRKCQVIIIDNHSFDKTADVASEYQQLFPGLIVFKKKSPHTKQLEKMLLHDYVQVINLFKIKKNENHLPPEKWPLWLERTLNVLSKRSKHNIEPKHLIKRLEQDHQSIYQTLRTEFLEPLINVQMHIEHTHLSGESTLSLNNLISKMHHVLSKYDPSQYNGDSLLKCITDEIERFTTRTQISCAVKETGLAPKVDYYLGISIIKMLSEALEVIEKHGQASLIHIRLRWSSKKLYLHVYDNSKTTNNHALSLRQLAFIEERVAVLNGEYRFRQKHGIDLLLEIPFSDMTGDANET